MTRPACHQQGPCDGHNCYAHIDWWCDHAGAVRVFSAGERPCVDPYCYALPFVVRERFGGDDPRHGLVEFECLRVVMRP